MPTVSVLLPAHNHAAFIAESIRSALDQSFADLELIVVDDGSTDGTDGVVGGIADSRLRYIRQENRGVAAALNTAYGASNGDLVAILNDDDVWVPDKLAVQVQALAEHPDVSVVHGRAQLIDAQGKSMPQPFGVPPRFPGRMLESLLYENSIVPATVLVRRSCLERAGPWDETLSGADDWDLWLRIACAHRFLFLDRVLAHYRFHQANLSGGRLPGFLLYQENRLAVLDKFFAQSECREQAAGMRTVAYRNLYTAVGLKYIGVGCWRRGTALLARAVQADPRPVTLGRALSGLIIGTLLRSGTGRRLAAALITGARGGAWTCVGDVERPDERAAYDLRIPQGRPRLL